MITILLGLTGCCFGGGPGCMLSDSSLGDAGVVADPNASALFGPAQTIFKKQCIQCHASFGTYSEAGWIASGYIVPGDAANSTIYNRIRGTGVGGPQNMPPGTTIATSDADAIKNWIMGMNSGNVPATGASQRLAAAMIVLNKTYPVTGKTCMNCHNVTRVAVSGAFSGATVPAFGLFTQDSNFVTSGLVVTGFPVNSWLYRSLRTHGDIATMPKGETVSISAGDAATLSDWITNIGNP
jgi:mono/diheme cytochrome c family protein